MKTSLQLLLVLFLSSAELQNEALSDYFEYEVGAWWDYEQELEDHINDLTSVSEDRTERVDCELKEDCFSEENSEGVTTYYLEDNVLYFLDINGKELTQNYTALNLEGYKEEIAEDDYEAFGFTAAEEGAQVECEYSLIEDYEFEDYSDTAIFEECEIAADISVDAFRILTEVYYLKGIGLVEGISRAYVDSTLVLQITQNLLETSLLEESPFSDVQIADPDNEAIEFLYEEGIISGYPDGSFKPENTMNRAELMKILVEGADLAPDAETYKDCFPDVGTDWYAKYVCYAKARGWVSGYPDGYFRPANSVNRVEALKMLLNSQDVEISTPTEEPYPDVSVDAWYAPYVATAKAVGLLEEIEIFLDPAAESTREEISEYLYRLLQIQ